jgi:acyl-CoA thioesterase FadM
MLKGGSTMIPTLVLNTQKERKIERRKQTVDYNRRKFVRRGREFVFPLKVYLSDTNAFGNVYFAQYFIWQGKTREDWLSWVMGEEAGPLMQKYKMATVEASHKYRHECLAFQNVEIGLVATLTRMSVRLVFNFRFKGTNKIVGIGNQKIAFIDHITNKLVPVPIELKRNMKKLKTVSEDQE